MFLEGGLQPGKGRVQIRILGSYSLGGQFSDSIIQAARGHSTIVLQSRKGIYTAFVVSSLQQTTYGPSPQQRVFPACVFHLNHFFQFRIMFHQRLRGANFLSVQQMP
jgi:hypothetical protein